MLLTAKQTRRVSQIINSSGDIQYELQKIEKLISNSVQHGNFQTNYRRAMFDDTRQLLEGLGYKVSPVTNNKNEVLGYIIDWSTEQK